MIKCGLILRFLRSKPSKLCGRRIATSQGCSSSSAIVKVDANEPGCSNKSSPSGDSWKSVLVSKLEKEVKAEHLRYSIIQGNRAQYAQLVRYAIEEDLTSLISVIYQRVKATRNRNKLTDEDDQFISCGFMVILRSLERSLKHKERLNSPEMLSIFFSYANLWDHIRLFGGDMRICSVLVYDKFSLWSKLRTADESSEEVAQILVSMANRLNNLVKRVSLSNSQLWLSPSDRDHLIKLLFGFGTDLNTKKRHTVEDSLYDQNPLLNQFRAPISKEAYKGNPYRLKGVTSESYVEIFPAQIATEKASWLYVENYLDSPEKKSNLSAESLIDSWGWLEKLQLSIERLLEERAQNPLRMIVKVIQREELAKMILESLKAVCSQGQNLVPITMFHYNIVSPILRSIHSKFVQKLGIDEVEMWSSVFADYAALFENENIARSHTHREWWVKCCRRVGIQPSYRIFFEEFHTETRRQVATFLTQVVIDACKFPVVEKGKKTEMLNAFTIRNVAIQEESYISEEGRITMSKMLSIDSNLLKLLIDHPFEHIAFPTFQLPMTVPPRPWCDGGLGGPEYTRHSLILRNLAEYRHVDINRQMKKRLKSPMQARPVFDALNQLGSTPWRINEPMLDILCQVFEMSSDVSKVELLDKLSMPLRPDTVNIPNIEDFIDEREQPANIKKVQYAEYNKRKAECIKRRNELNSLWCWMKYRIVLARHFKDKTLFFPHNMDFRGRVYPISPYLNHMGDDVNRCMLKFAKGRPLGERGLFWLKLHCINLTGKMKKDSIADRLAAADKLLDDMIDSANHPLDGKGWWLQSEEPWQTLAACMELRDALIYRGRIESFVSHLAIHQDGSCNGLQHYAALGRDVEGGREVNLLSSSKPNDVYTSVAMRVEQKRLEDEKGGQNTEVALRLRDSLPCAVPRKVIKQTVMTTVYGVTLYGAAQQIKRQLRTLDINNDETSRFARYLTDLTFASLHDAFTCSMKLKDWFRECAKGVSDLLQTMEWITPLGLPVVQPYVIAKEKKGRVIYSPVSTKQVGAFPPNLVHSLDSSHMMLTSLDCSRRGITFAAVHDCFWTHANTVDDLGFLCREQFVRLHSEPILQQFSDWLHSRYLTGPHIDLMSSKQLAYFRKVFTLRVNPGDLNINDVKESIYFFS